MTAKQWAARIRRELAAGASVEHAAGVQWFFKEEVKSHGWYTAPLRRFSFAIRKEIVKDGGLPLLIQVADLMFTGDVLEEKNVGVMLLQKDTAKLGDREFRLFQRWLGRVSSWADHDALVMFLIGPMAAAEPARATRVFRWAWSKSRWCRRAAAVTLIHGARRGLFTDEIDRTTRKLLDDPDDMVQKGLGWLLREAAKFYPKRTMPLLLDIRSRAPRLVLRTACEKLNSAQRRQVLGEHKVRAATAQAKG